MKEKVSNLLMKMKKLTKKQWAIIAGAVVLAVALPVGAILLNQYIKGSQEVEGTVIVTFLNPDGSEIKTLEKQMNDSLLEEEYPDVSEVKLSPGKRFAGWDISYIRCLTEDVTITAMESAIQTANDGTQGETLVIEAEDGAYWNSKGEKVNITDSEAATVQSVSFNSYPKEGTVTVDFCIVAEKETTVMWSLKMGNRKGGTFKLADMFSFELKQAGSSKFEKVATEGVIENKPWDIIWGDFVSADIATITLKKGENYLSIVGIPYLTANIDTISLTGDIEGLSHKPCEPIKRDASGNTTTSATQTGLVIEAEDTKYSMNTGDDVTISETEKKTVKSVYMKHPSKTGTKVTIEYTIVAESDKTVDWNVIMGHRKGGEFALDTLMTFEMQAADASSYSKVASSGKITNVAWDQYYGHMGTATIAKITLKKGENHFRITGTEDLYANIDKFVLDGNVKGLSVKKATTYTITFVNPDGSVIKTITKHENASLTAKDYPNETEVKVSNGLTFVGWDVTSIEKITSNVTIKALENRKLVMEAEDAYFYSSTNNQVFVTDTEKQTVKSVYMNQGVVTIDYTVMSNKAVTLRLDITMGHRKGGTHKLSDMLTFEVSNDGGNTYNAVKTDSTLTNTHWFETEGAGQKFGDMATTTVANVALKAGENHIKITGINELYANINNISLIGDTTGVTFKPLTVYTITFLNPDGSTITSIEKRENTSLTSADYPDESSITISEGKEFIGWNIEYVEKVTSDLYIQAMQGNKLVLEAENADISTSTGADAVVTNTQSGAVQSIYMKQDAATTPCAVTLDYSLVAENDVTLTLNITMGHRKGGTNNLEDILDFEISYDRGNTYSKVDTTGVLTNTHWLATEGPGEKWGDMATVTVAQIQLKAGENHIRIKGGEGLYANIDSISLVGDTAGVKVGRDEPQTTKVFEAEKATFSSNTETEVKITDTQSATVKSVYMNNGIVTIEYAINLTGTEAKNFMWAITMGHRSGGERNVSDMLQLATKVAGATDFTAVTTDAKINNAAWATVWGDMQTVNLNTITLQPGKNILRITGANALFANIDSISLIGNTDLLSVAKTKVLEAENATNTSSTGAAVVVSSFSSGLKSVYMKNGVVTIDYTILATEDVTLNMDITLGHRTSGTYNLADLMSFAVKTATDTEYQPVSTTGSFTNTWGFNVDSSFVTAHVNEITLKQGENHIRIQGINELYANIDSISLTGNTDAIGELKSVVLEAESATLTSSTGSDVVISSFSSGLKSVYMNNGVVTIDYTINATADVTLQWNITLGHRTSGTYNLANIMNFAVKTPTDTDYQSVSTTGSFTNTWSWGNNSSFATTTVNTINLKAGENHIRIQGNANLMANIDSITLIGDTSKIQNN